MTTGQGSTLADDLGVEDIEVPCEITIVVFAVNRRGRRKATTHRDPCENPARFHGRTMCCGDVVLACDEHATDGRDMWCEACKRDTPSHKMNWQRL